MKKTILITGGTGFLGKRLGLALKENYNVILTGRNNKQNFLAKKITGCEVVPMDVSNIESIRDVFGEFRPNIVIHAAATKFVDLAEKQPMECVDVNVLGSQNVARVCLEKNVEIVVAVSTDKASPPVRNTYGLSKAIMERVFCSMNGKSATKFTAVRYGNVAWSTGSVLPVWKKMFEETNVLGTTGPEMRRFFFTVDEAVKLVITAIDNIDEVQGKVLSREMKAAKMKEILENWISVFGGKWEIIEGRPGERNDEYLIGELELDYTIEKVYDSVKHYLISFNEKQENCIKSIISSENVEKLTNSEIVSILKNPPAEEK